MVVAVVVIVIALGPTAVIVEAMTDRTVGKCVANNVASSHLTMTILQFDASRCIVYELSATNCNTIRKQVGKIQPERNGSLSATIVTGAMTRKMVHMVDCECAEDDCTSYG